MIRHIPILDIASAAVMLFVVGSTIRNTPHRSGPYDVEAAEQGKVVFETRAGCASCHDPEHSDAAGPGASSTTMAPPLRNLRAPQRRFYHDGRFGSLQAVVDHYDRSMNLHLTDGQKQQLLEYLKSL